MKTLITKKMVNTIFTIDQLKIKIPIHWSGDVGHRGGYLGCNSLELCNYLGLSNNPLPNKFGVYVNYLGGGLRGSLCKSMYQGVNRQISIQLDRLHEILITIYTNIEEENVDPYEDEWGIKGTQAARKAGIKSAY